MRKRVFETGINQRGFQYAEPIKNSAGSSIQVYESSNVIPSIWVQSLSPAHMNLDGKETDTMVQLTLEEARLFRDQLNYILENHYNQE